MTKFAEHKAGKAHFDFGETSAVPEIHIGEKKPEVEQRKAEKMGNVLVIKDGVAVPEVMRED